MSNLSKFRPAGELDTTPSGKLLYLVLTDNADEEGNLIIPQKHVAKALGFSRSTVSRNLRKLFRRGYIDIIAQFNEYGCRLPNKYVVLER